MFFKFKIKYNDIIIMTIPYSKQQPPPINQLPNVNINASLADGEVLTYNDTTKQWENKEASGGATEIVATDNLITPDLNAGAILTSGASNNILLGTNAGKTITTTDNNIAIGIDSLSLGTVKNNNIAIGTRNSKTGTNNYDNNITIGTECCENAVFRFNGNTLLGYQAGRFASGLDTSVILGYGAGYLANLTHTIAMGYEVCRNATCRDTIAIGATAHYGGNDINGICLGVRSGFGGCGNHSILVGTKAGEGAKFNNTIVLNATGVAVNAPSASSFVVKPIRNATGSNALFYDATSGEITYDTAGGATSIVATENIITPDLGAGPDLTSTAENNIFIGKNTGRQVSTADYNVAIGFNNCHANQSGGVYIGKDVCSQAGAGSTNIVAIGYETAKANYDGTGKVFIGTQAGYYRGGGSNYNVGIGHQALYNGRQGTSSQACIALGGFAMAGKVQDGNTNNSGGGDVIAIGFETHKECRPQISSSIFIGTNVARRNDLTTAQGRDCVAIGHQTHARFTTTTNPNNRYSTVVGAYACNQGITQTTFEGGLFLGYGAGRNVAHGNQIILNGGPVHFDSPNTDVNGFFVRPVREVAHHIGSGLTYYDTTRNELTVSSTDITKAHAKWTPIAPATTRDFTGFAQMIFDTTDFNSNSFYNTGTGRFTSPTNGLYTFQLHYQLSTNDVVVFNWRVNGFIKQTDEVYNAHGGSSFRTFQSTFTTILATNEYVELELASTSGTVRFENSKYDGVRAYYVGK